MIDKNINLGSLANYKELFQAIGEHKNISVFGMGQSQKFLTALNSSRPILFVTADATTAKRVFEEFNVLTGTKASYLPAGSDILLYRKAQSNENNIERIKTIFELVNNKTRVVVASVDALLSYLPNAKNFKASITKFKVNETIEQHLITSRLVAMGYVSATLVAEPGQFSVRGDIVDIFPINAEYPYRIEMFDNLIESIKLFDPETQRSSESKREMVICPYTNLLLNNEDVAQIVQKLSKLRKTKLNSREAETRLETLLDEIEFKLKNKDISFSLDFVFPLIENSLSTIFDYLNPETLIIFDESKMVYDALTKTEENILQEKKTLAVSGDSLPVRETGYLTKEKVISGINKFTLLAHQKITSANKLFNPDAVFSFRFAPTIKYVSNFNEFVSDITLWVMDGYKIIICAGDEKQARSLKNKLENNDIFIDVNPRATLLEKNSVIIPEFLSTGFVLPENKIVVVGTHDLFPRKVKETSLLVKKKAIFSVPEVGSFVVHKFHGIGKCEGVTKLTGSFGTKDFIVVGYHGGDKLYVPIDQMDQLDKYTAGADPKKLSKIGGAEFSAVKERVKKQIKEMAFSLLNLYAEREAKSGYIYSKDEELQLEFEHKFPYTETEDQLKAILEVKNDMQEGKVMDRLICGDVGFGKTEVALRSAFKTIVNGKQVAFIAPTTILARQHYNTCLARMGEFGVRVGVLDRFLSPKEVKETLRLVSQHKIDILCGTHRVLSKDVVFEDLGLVILDEEQKFGVEHKEKIKLEQKNINCLTLSATPIPRTLHMALSGIRDISVISTPPTNRTPTQTYVTEYTDNLLKSVVERELARDGQVFIVYNRVESIYAFADKVKSLVPNAKIVVGHGQLSGTELEDVIYKFYNHLADVLICTTIIENGIDLPNANSLIVMDSDRLGLSQLYQIRGRVGRGNRAGFAYFTYKPEKSLSEDSYKRLEAISEFTEFGSGFKVAMRDLEIRGSGNVFGAEQHGHIEKVGYELYSKMLQNALIEIKGGKVEDETEVQVKVNLDAFIPSGYINHEEERMTIYKNISLISSLEDKTQIEEELLDRYGKLPIEIKNLIDIAYVKAILKTVGVTEIFMSDKVMRLTLKSGDYAVKEETLAEAISKFSNNVVLNLVEPATINFKMKNSTPMQNFNMLKEFVMFINSKKIKK